MNQLYRIIPKVFLNNIQLCPNIKSPYQLRYGEIPKLDFVKFTNFDEAWNNNLLLCSCDMTIFKKKYIAGYLGLNEYIRVNKKTFISYEMQDTVRTYKNNKFTITELAKLLPATEFVLWCKDQGFPYLSDTIVSKWR